MDAAEGERYAAAWRYIGFKSRAVRRFSNSEHSPEDGPVGPKHAAIDAISM
jgi:hypothetical protein